MDCMYMDKGKAECKKTAYDALILLAYMLLMQM